ncbi:MAG: MBL fold metallo-hydrolase [Elusimicrobiota bacterium]
MRRIAEGLYQLEAGGFVNAYLIVGSADLTLVDAGHSRSAGALAAELRDNAFDLRDIGRVVVTHAHADHVGGLRFLLGKHPIKVHAHPGDIPVLTGKAPARRLNGFKGFCLGFLHEHLLPWLPVEMVIPAEPGRPLRGIPQWQILHTPGHTVGSLSLFHPVKQILVCGDALSNRGGKLHLPEECFNEDPEALRLSVGKLSELDCDTLCCGHGPVLRGGAFRHIEAALAKK